MEIHHSARRHQVADEDIEHADEPATIWVELGDDPMRYLVVVQTVRAACLNSSSSVPGNLSSWVIHAMALRRSTERELFGRESR